MKKIIILMMVMVITTACSADASNETNGENEVAYNYVDSIDENLIECANADADIAFNMADPNELRKNVTNVFVANIESIDSSTCNLEGYEYSPIPYTLGNIKVLKNYIGEADESISFARLGGTVSIEEYDLNAPSELLEKREYLREQSDSSNIEYMNITFTNDIELSAGKTYLIYANYNEEYDRYEVIGLQYGTREIEGFDDADATIMNNESNEKEDFNSYINDYLN